MNNQLDIKTLLKPITTNATIYLLVNEITDIKIDSDGSIKSSVQHLADIKKLCADVSASIRDLIQDVSLVLGYSLDKGTGKKSPICHFFIVHNMSALAKDLDIFGKICERGIETKTWPTNFVDFQKHSFLYLLTQIPGACALNNSNLSEFTESARCFIDCQGVNLRIFSEALVAAHATGEIANYISGALEFNNQWIGFVEAIQYLSADASFDLNKQKAA